MTQEPDLDEHWLGRIRSFVGDALEEYEAQQGKLKGITLELEQSKPLDEPVTSAWVDGGSAHFDLSGGSLYIVRAAAGVFRPDAPIEWFSKTNVGFTTLPRDVDRFVGIQRDTLEIECILEALSGRPEFAVLDNGLASYATMGVPHSTLRYFTSAAPDDSPEYEYFEAFVKFMRRFDVLIQQCQVLNTGLIGATKDPRSRAYARSLGLGHRMIDASAIAMLARGQTGFTKPLKATYLEVPRVKNYLHDHSILTNGRGEFMRMFTILKPNSRVFRLDYLATQRKMMNRIRGFALSMHDGNGYLMPSHVVHNKAAIPLQLSDSLLTLVQAS
ncbi:MAG: DNA double-strand break repair nuclease NurA, partial [Candidatus Thorarchaeota archaeon]